METRYWYNTLNLPIKQYTPDGDTTRFWYDAVGRLVVSQSARQRPDTFSYTIYDPLGRITEVGRLSQTTDMEQTISQSPSSLGSWISGGSNRKEVTKTFYDASVFTVPGLEQENLRSRVASTTLMDTYSATITNYDVATHYSYDIAGNVKTIVNDIKSLNSYKERYKRIDYEYDLVSGNVNNVYYQRDSADQFIYEYTYDADNRILEAKTSRDGYIWDRDANYLYYNHGPLARTEIGEQQVQALDYAYSIQGWLKGINGLHLLKGHDMGQDGNSGAMQHKRFPVDVFGMNIGYFEGDYSQITKQIKWEPQYASSAFSSASKNLYNGNIRNIALSADKINPKTIGYSYGYDQLNRLVSMDAYSSFSGTNYEWPTTSNPLKDYRERVTYDANGNILTYNRHGEGTTWKMDSLEYNYYTDKNRLHYVDDKVSAGNYPEDIDDQSSGNYTYDASGNLITDTKEGITKIEWTTYGKVKKIIKSGTTLTFSYDPAGNRIYKKVATTGQPNVFTYYIRDAQGNIMSTYVLKSDTVRWSEQMMYGSSRLGIVNLNEITAPLTFNPTDTTTTGYLEGLKNYELTNHLGNVQAVVSDKKIGIDNNNDDINNYWIAEQLVAQDYYPFGMVMPERSFSYENYRFSFNGKEDDPEANIGYQDYGLRIYDKRLGKFLSVDPLTKKYPWYSPYHFAGNSPIRNIDLDGAEPKSKIEGWQQTEEYKTYGDHYNTGGHLQKVENFWVYSTLPSIGQTSTYSWYDDSKEPGQRWTEFIPHGTEPFDPSGYYALADLGQVVAGMVLLGSASLVEGVSLIALSTRLAPLKGTVSATTQLVVHKKIDVIDVLGDAYLNGVVSNSTVNSLFDLTYDVENGMWTGNVNNMSGNTSASMINTAAWQGLGNLGMGAVSPFIREGIERITMETLSSSTTTVGEEGFNQVIEDKQ